MKMINLAGNIKCDKTIKEELRTAGIPYIELIGRLDSEVPASVIGYFNGFLFQRAWYYWIVKGYMPLEYANELYDKYKELNIRVSGEDGIIEPSQRSESREYEKECKKLANKYLKKEISLDEVNRRADKIKKQGKQFVTSYHIDTQEGLLRFAEIIKKYNIIG